MSLLLLAVLRIIDQNMPGVNTNAPEVQNFLLPELTVHSVEGGTGNKCNLK